MALNFPYPAVDGQVFTSNGVVYVYNSTYSSWVISPVANTIVTLVSGTAGQIYSSGGYAPSLNLITTGVTANTYGGASQIPVITVDAYGRLTSASNVAVQGMDYAYANTVGAASNGWANTVVAGANAWSNTKVSSVTGTAGQIYSSGGTTPTLNLIATTVTATTYGGASQIPVITVDAYGRLTSASNVAVQGMDYAYANTIGASSNAWTNAVFGYANTRMESMVAANAVSANAWTNTSVAGANAWTNAVFGYANTSIAAANGWANTVVAGANAWVNTSVVGANAWSNTKLSNTTTTLAGDLTISGQGGGIILTGSPLFQAAANVTQNSTISAGYNAMSPGPVTINSGYSVNVASGSVWTVV